MKQDAHACLSSDTSPVRLYQSSEHREMTVGSSQVFYRPAMAGANHASMGPGGPAGDKMSQGVVGAPNEAALLSLMERTGYGMIQENGQRKYGGPPPGWEGPAPPRGCEIFIGKIPRDCYEDELVPVFEKIGAMYELRLMMDFSGSNRGYAFVMYTTKNDARRAVKELNNYEIRKGRLLGVCLSVDNCRLFVGGIPKNKQKEEILQEMRKVTEGVEDVIVYPSATDKSKNRGFAFVEYESHRAAAMARRKLIPGRIQLWGHQIAVDWAEPEQEVDEEIMCKVKILYVRNLMLSTSEEAIEGTFNKATGKEGAVERVKKIRDYAFVHFREREDALNALTLLNETNLEGSMIEVCLAKPVDKNDYVRYTRGTTRMPQGYTSYAYDAPYASPTMFGQFGAAAAVAAAAATSPTATARGLQGRSHLGFRGAMRGRGRGAAGSRGAGTRGYLGGYMRGGFRKPPGEGRLYDILPGMELTPTNPITLKPQSIKSSPQVLEELCQKNGWGSPAYTLHSTMGRDGSGDMQLFLYKISIPALSSQYPNGVFQPPKLCRSLEEAKNFAAEHVMMQLGVPMEGSESVQATVATVVSTPSTVAYQGRPIGPAYPVSNGAAARSDMTYATSMPVVTTASYVVGSPAKMHPSMPHTHSDLGGYEQYGQFAAAGIPAYQQY